MRHNISQESEKIRLKFRSPATDDASEIWRLVVESGVLDSNSAYLYLLLCRDFRETCLVATRDDEVVGFVTGYRMPSDPSVLFIWQIGVATTEKRKGIASRLLAELIRHCGIDTLSAIEATVSPSNVASRKLFESLSRSLGVSLKDQPQYGFTTSDFPPGNHEAEPRIHIGPLSSCVEASDQLQPSAS